MYPQPFIPPDLRELAARGDVRRISHGPSTISEVLERHRLEQEADDNAEAYRNDPVAWLRAHRPRRRLIDVLLRRQ